MTFELTRFRITTDDHEHISVRKAVSDLQFTDSKITGSQRLIQKFVFK